MVESHSASMPRLHCLDWLRVFAIGVLVVYHIGMVYVPDWGYHFKNPLNSDLIQSFMLLTSPWRMGLLWLISGMAFVHMCHGKSLFGLALKRSNQILLPLLIGVLFVVPFQLFAQMKQAGDMPLDFIDFAYAFYIRPQDYFVQYSSGIWPRFDVNHLWFLRSLWRYSMVILILSPFLKSAFVKKVCSLIASNIVYLVLVIAIPIAVIETFLEGEDVRESYGLTMLLIGYCFGMQAAFWQSLSRHLVSMCILSLVAILGLQIGFVLIWQNELHQANQALALIIETIYLANKILPLLAILGLSYRFLNHPNTLIRALNPYVFGLYVLHQSVIIFVAYVATTCLPTKSPVSFIQAAEYQIWINMLVTPLICAALLLAIARFNILRICFGMRWKNKADPYQSGLTNTIVFLVCLPLMIALVI
ncbi:acyltransferase [Glaciecola siphonariae]|uniref:Acyltransferase n=1 Tax=Glaciecola siphonariae TaxID=521012 RepID=A0ABV9LUE5_9ALTE